MDLGVNSLLGYTANLDEIPNSPSLHMQFLNLSFTEVNKVPETLKL